MFTLVDQTLSMTTCVDETTSMPSREQNASQQVLSCPQMYLNIFRPKPFHAKEDTKFISAFVDHAKSFNQTPPMPAWTQIASQHL